MAASLSPDKTPLKPDALQSMAASTTSGGGLSADNLQSAVPRSAHGVFYETRNFTVEACPTPHVGRTDGGHIIIKPKEAVINRWDLQPELAIELMRLSMIVGEAMVVAMNERGIPVERINFQDNGNWAIGTVTGPRFHLHLYGRASNPQHQARGEALYFPPKATEFWKALAPLDDKDITAILRQIDRMSIEDRYKPGVWKLTEA